MPLYFDEQRPFQFRTIYSDIDDLTKKVSELEQRVAKLEGAKASKEDKDVAVHSDRS